MKVTGTDLRIIRLKAKKTTMEMANIAGVKTRKTYENWEKGTCTPSINQFIIMASACGIDVTKFFRQVAHRQSEYDPIDIAKCLRKS